MGRPVSYTHLIPIHDVRVQVDAEPFDDVLDIVDRELGIPAAVEMHRQRAQAQAPGGICLLYTSHAHQQIAAGMGGFRGGRWGGRGGHAA